MSKEQLEMVEALETASPLMARMISAIKGLIREYDGNKAADTEEYMHNILQGLEWIFALYRSTKDLVNASGVINQDEVNASVIKLNRANEAQDDAGRVEAFKGILKFVETFKSEADSIAKTVAA